MISCMSKTNGERITMFPPQVEHRQDGNMLLVTNFLEGLHLDVNKIPVQGNGAFKEIGVTWPTKCPFTSAERTAWQLYGRTGDITTIERNFANDNRPTEEARRVIFENL